MKLLGMFALMLVILAACGGDDDDVDTGASDANDTMVVATATEESPGASTLEPISESTTTSEPTATEEPAAQLAAIGSTITFDSGQTVTIHAIERPVTSDIWTPQTPGNEFMALDIEECAGPNVPADETVSANPHDFVFIMPDNTRVTPYVGVREPALNLVDLLAGDCVRGWATFEIATGVQPAEIRYEGYDWEYNQLIGRWST